MQCPLPGSVVIGDLNVGWPGLRPVEADAELIVDPDAELSGPVPLQSLQAIPRWKPEGGQAHRRIQLVELPPGNWPKARGTRAPGGLCVAAVKDVLRPSFGKGDNHWRSVQAMSRNITGIVICARLRVLDCCLTTCASAAGPHARVRTNLRSASSSKELGARAEPGTGPARRLHALVRRYPDEISAAIWQDGEVGAADRE